MYEWLWKKLPGNKLAKTLEALALAAAVIALLFFVIFPLVNQWITEVTPSTVGV
ncbi:MAG: hypothetical protein ACKOWE_05465 [Micrococcales bacterium]